jgi:hypothetical protein
VPITLLGYERKPARDIALVGNGIKDTQAAMDAAQCVASSDPRLKMR